MADMRKAFLADIIENIDDDTPRLVFADWLEDHGDEARAEFIRLQCSIAAEKPWPQPTLAWDRDGSLTARESELIGEHGAEWSKEAPKWVTKNFAYYRGFVGRVRATRPVWLEGVGRLYLHVPVEGLGVSNMDDAFLTFLTARAECKYLRQLQFPAYDCSSAVLSHFFASADLRRLVTLDYKTTTR